MCLCFCCFLYSLHCFSLGKNCQETASQSPSWDVRFWDLMKVRPPVQSDMWPLLSMENPLGFLETFSGEDWRFKFKHSFWGFCFVWCFSLILFNFKDSTMVNHHGTSLFGIIFLELVPSISSKSKLCFFVLSLVFQNPNGHWVCVGLDGGRKPTGCNPGNRMLMCESTKKSFTLVVVYFWKGGK